jgi:glycosyltransferase involved in cell wall biosynthesis
MKDRIAILHDYIGSIGGAEKVVLTLAHALNADVITTDTDKSTLHGIAIKNVRILSLGNTLKITPLKQISASFRFASCNLTGDYDFFILSGNFAYYAAKKHHPNIYYCHTPMESFYDGYGDMIDTLQFPRKEIAQIWVFFHKKYDRYYMNFVDKIITNSEYTKRRVKRYYGKNSTVIYPPIDTSRYHFKKVGEFWLSVTRLIPTKRIDLQIEAFRHLPEEKLIITGGYAKGEGVPKYLSKLFRKLPKNVKILPESTSDELAELYGNCKAFITTSAREGFGMAAVEAMAAGKPVLAVKEGGYLETIEDGITGRLVNVNLRDIINAIKDISKDPLRFRENCERRAKMFDVSVFLERIRSEIDKLE